jgi:hypothetical protein
LRRGQLKKIKRKKMFSPKMVSNLGRLTRKITVEGEWGEREIFLQWNLIQEQTKIEERCICKKVSAQKVDIKRTELEF